MLIKDFTTVFSLAKAIESPDNDGTIFLDKELFPTKIPLISIQTEDLNDPNNWNKRTQNLTASLFGIFKQIDHSQNLLIQTRNTLFSKLDLLEGALVHLNKDSESFFSERSTVYNKVYTPLDLPNFEKIPLYPKAVYDSREKAISGSKAGSFSLNKNEGYFGGKVKVERWTGNLTEKSPEAIVDSNLSTSWSTSILSKSPIKTSTSGDPWVREYFDNKATVLLTFDLSRPTSFNAVLINSLLPVSLEKISWRNSQTPQCLTNSDLAASGSWTATNFTISGGKATLTGGSASLTQTVDLLSSAVQGAFSANPVDLTSSRVEVIINTKGSLLSPFKVNFNWKDSSGITIREHSEKITATGGWSDSTIIDFVPEGAEDLDLSITYDPSVSSTESLEISSFEAYIGESSYEVSVNIEGSKTVSLPHTITTDRISVILSKEFGEISYYTPPQITNPSGSLPSFFLNDVKNKIQEGSYLEYKFSLQEIDFLYDQYLPECGFYTSEIRPDKEIRSIAFKIEGENLGQGAVNTTIYPVHEDYNIFRSFTSDSGSFRIITTEEEEAGWNSVDSSDIVIVKPQKITEEFNGTDLFGRIQLEYAPHVSKVKVKKIKDWVGVHYIYKIPFNPNIKKYFGLKSASLADLPELQTKGVLSVEQLEADLEICDGYMPVEVTVENEHFTAVPDTLGPPNSFSNNVIIGEELTNISFEVSKKIKQNSAITFDEWSGAITLRNYLSISQYRDTISKNLSAESLDLSIKKAIEGGLLGGLKDLIKNDFDKNLSGKDGDVTETITAVQSAFKTLYFPLMEGEESIQISVTNNSTSATRILEPGEYQVYYEIGVIKLTISNLPGDYSVFANYKPKNTMGRFVNSGWFKLDDGTVFGSNVKFPLTRNVTDYETWEELELRPLNLDQNSPNYYPILEYRVKPNGELIFSRELSPFSSYSSKISVSYDTLKQKAVSKIILNSEDLPPKITSIKIGLE